jgi:YbbR domain-containing protein
MIIKNNKQGNIWFIRIMSLIAACVLWVYVMNEQNPFISRTFSATVSTSNLPSSMVVNYLPETVKVRVSGPRSQISALNDDSIQAYVDFTDAKPGKGLYAVQARSAFGEIVEIMPERVELEVDAVKEKQVEIEPRIVGVPNSGITVGKMDINPATVTLKGAGGRVDAVSKVVVLVDISNKEKSFEDEATVVALNKDGREMYDVHVQPNKVKVSVVVVKQLGTNIVPIIADLSGSLPTGFQVASIKITPDKVKLTAEPGVLANIHSIKMAPVVLDKITGDVELKMPLKIPDNVLADTHNAIVEIKIKKTE